MYKIAVTSLLEQSDCFSTAGAFQPIYRIPQRMIASVSTTITSDVLVEV
jgi:hypothetical protein